MLRGVGFHKEQESKSWECLPRWCGTASGNGRRAQAVQRAAVLSVTQTGTQVVAPATAPYLGCVP
eukprot:5027716-Prymnesium_polylepis.2